MATTDPIGEFLTQIRNAQMARHESVEVAYSKLRSQMVRILEEEGYVAGYKQNEKQPVSTLTLLLKYGPGREPVIRRLARISRPGRRFYAGKDDIPVILGGLGITILSTSKGILSGKKAKELGVGGEVLCEVY
jgi:small subunit ribosomal protein S8